MLKHKKMPLKKNNFVLTFPSVSNNKGLTAKDNFKTDPVRE